METETSLNSLPKTSENTKEEEVEKNVRTRGDRGHQLNKIRKLNFSDTEIASTVSGLNPLLT